MRRVRQHATQRPSRVVRPAPARVRRPPATHPVLRLQRRIGNHAAATLLQTKLRVGRPDDSYEEEAERVADRVMRMHEPEGEPEIQRLPIRSVQRRCPGCEEKKEAKRDDEGGPAAGPILQRRKGAARTTVPGTASPSVEGTVTASRGRGAPLSPGSRGFFEPRFGSDFSSVRVHTDARSASAARELKARAFTVGRDIYFGEGQYRPGSRGGQRLLAHELTHVVQQGGGGAARRAPVRRMPAQAEPLVQRQEETEVAERTSAAPTGRMGVESAEDLAEDEVEIPTFHVGGEGECFQLVPEETCEPPKGSGGPLSVPEGITSKLISVAMSGPGGWLARKILAVSARGALAGWRRLPLRIRAWVIDRAIDLALAGTDFVPRVVLRANVGARWLHAGIKGFLRQLRKEDARKKVAAFEKYLEVFFGQSDTFMLGYGKGLLCGFFVDGLVGVIQMVIDLVCLVMKIPDFIEAFRKFFGAFSEEMERIAQSIVELTRSLGDLMRNAVAEVKELLRSPGRIARMIETMIEKGEEVAGRAGSALARQLIALSTQPAERLGFRVGQATGVIAFEVVLALLTMGGGLAVTAVKGLVKLGVKLVAMIGKHLLTIVRVLRPLFRIFRNTVSSVKKLLTRGFEVVAGKLEKVLDAIRDFFGAILRRCRPGSVKCKVPRKRRRKKDRDGDGGDAAVIARFRARVRRSIGGRVAQDGGISKDDLDDRASAIRRRNRRFRQAIRSLTVSKIGARYRLRALTSSGPRTIVRPPRLKTGASRAEAIPIRWYKPLRGYPNPLSLNPRRDRWAARDRPSIRSLSMHGKTELEVPPTQHGSFYPPVARVVRRGRKTFKYIDVGVAAGFLPHKDKMMKRTKAKGVPRPMQGRFRTLMKNYGVAGMRRFEIDHVQDIGFGGVPMDNLRNLWPLLKSRNRRGNRVYHEEVAQEVGGRRHKTRPLYMIGKWFKIR